MIGKNRLFAAAAVSLAAAAAIGFGVARVTQPGLTAPAPETSAPPEKPVSDTIAITSQSIAASQIAVARAAAGDLDATILAPATIEAAPDAAAVLTARAPGIVARILVGIGDTVRAGQTLALVESRDAAQITADRATATARVKLAARQLARERTLLEQGVSPRADLEAAQATLALAQADARRADVAAGAAGVSADGRFVAVSTPVSGRVTNAAAHLGQYVPAETELFRVADPGRLQITASVPPADASRIRNGDRVALTTGDGRAIAGRVRPSTGVVDPASRMATVIVTPSTGADTLAPGQLARARIMASGGAATNGVTVPQDAVQTLGDRTVVFVRTPAGFTARTVRVGTRSGGLVAIVDGLAAGTPVATANAFLLKAELEKEAAE